MVVADQGVFSVCKEAPPWIPQSMVMTILSNGQRLNIEGPASARLIMRMNR